MSFNDINLKYSLDIADFIEYYVTRIIINNASFIGTYVDNSQSKGFISGSNTVSFDVDNFYFSQSNYKSSTLFTFI